MMREDDGIIGELIFIAKNLDVMIWMEHRASKVIWVHSAAWRLEITCSYLYR